jgi:hypothetical protein
MAEPGRERANLDQSERLPGPGSSHRSAGPPFPCFPLSGLDRPWWRGRQAHVQFVRHGPCAEPPELPGPAGWRMHMESPHIRPDPTLAACHRGWKGSFPEMQQILARRLPEIVGAGNSAQRRIRSAGIGRLEQGRVSGQLLGPRQKRSRTRSVAGVPPLPQ